MSDEPKVPGTRVELPCGLFRDGKAERDAEIVPMTGRVRTTIARPDVRRNGAKIVDAVLLACVREIGGRRVDRQVLDDLLIGDRDFQRWREDIVNIALSGNRAPDGLPSPMFRRNVMIELYDKAGIKVKEWEVYEAWPAVLEVGALDAESNDVLIETLELANEGFNQIM